MSQEDDAYEDYQENYAEPNYYRQPVSIASIYDGYQRAIGLASNITIVFECQPDVALMLLSRERWNEDKVMAKLANSRAALDELEYAGAQRITEVKTQPCPICFEDNTTFVTIGCQHLICLSCTKQYIKTKVKAGQTFPLCSDGECPYRYMPSIILTILNNSILAQTMYKALIVRGWVTQFPNALLCQTSETCNVILIRNDEEIMESECPRCLIQYCWKCKAPHHAPMNCRQSQTWQQILLRHQHFKSMGWIADNAVQCPQCKLAIQRSHGCNHMTCQRPQGCGTQFCYRCRKLWDGPRHECSYFIPWTTWDEASLEVVDPKVISLYEDWMKQQKQLLEGESTIKRIQEFGGISKLEASKLRESIQKLKKAIRVLRNFHPLILLAGRNDPMKEVYISYQEECELMFNVNMDTLEQLKNRLVSELKRGKKFNFMEFFSFSECIQIGTDRLDRALKQLQDAQNNMHWV